MKRAMLLISLLGAMSPSCAPIHVEPARIKAIRDYSATYLCDGGASIQVRFAPFKANLESQGTSVEMTQRPADDFLYTAGGQSLHAHGDDDATWTDDKGTVRQCQVAVIGVNRKTTLAPISVQK